MTIREYNRRMRKLLRGKSAITETDVIAAHQTIEKEDKIFLNLSHEDIKKFIK